MDFIDYIASIFGLALCIAIAWSNWPRHDNRVSFEPTDYNDWIA